MSYFNEDQESYMRYLATVPREQKCNSGWHIAHRENCNCGPYKPCAVDGCLRGQHRDSDRYCYEHSIQEQEAKQS